MIVNIDKSDGIDAVFSLMSTMYSRLVDILRVQISICCNFLILQEWQSKVNDE